MESSGQYKYWLEQEYWRLQAFNWSIDAYQLDEYEQQHDGYESNATATDDDAETAANSHDVADAATTTRRSIGYEPTSAVNELRWHEQYGNESNGWLTDEQWNDDEPNAKLDDGQPAIDDVKPNEHDRRHELDGQQRHGKYAKQWSAVIL